MVSEYALRNHQLEVQASNLELRLPHEAAVIRLLAPGIVSAEDIRLVGLVVRRVDAMQRVDLVLRQACRGVLAGAAGQRLGTEALGAKSRTASASGTEIRRLVARV